MDAVNSIHTSPVVAPALNAAGAHRSQVATQSSGVPVQDKVDLSTPDELIKSALTIDPAKLDKIFDFSSNLLQDFTSEYQSRRTAILRATEGDSEVSGRREQLLGQLDKVFTDHIKNYASRWAKKVDDIAIHAQQLDNQTVQKGLRAGYQGTRIEGLSDAERTKITGGIEKIFTNSMSYVKQHGSGEGITAATAEQGSVMKVVDLQYDGGRKGDSNLERFDDYVRYKHESLENIIRIRKENNYVGSNVWSEYRHMAFMDDTSIVDRHSGFMQGILGRIMEPISKYDAPSAAVAGAVTDEISSAVTQTSKLSESDARAFFDRYASRISQHAPALSDAQKVLVGRLYEMAEKKGDDESLAKVDEFAKALATGKPWNLMMNKGLDADLKPTNNPLDMLLVVRHGFSTQEKLIESFTEQLNHKKDANAKPDKGTDSVEELSNVLQQAAKLKTAQTPAQGTTAAP